MLLLWPSSGLNFRRHFSDFLSIWNIFGGRGKEKIEDENCEYEMMWDAEGSMHLVKKTLNAPITNASEKGLVERCHFSSDSCFCWDYRLKIIDT